MELDKRIEKLSDILTCFDVKDAGQFLGQEGYFSDCFDHYRCLASRKYGILTEIKDSDCPFKEGDDEKDNDSTCSNCDYGRMQCCSCKMELGCSLYNRRFCQGW